MAHVKFCCDAPLLPNVPIYAFVRSDRIFGEDKPAVPVLHVGIGADTLTVWPCDDDVLGRFIDELAKARTKLQNGGSR